MRDEREKRGEKREMNSLQERNRTDSAVKIGPMDDRTSGRQRKHASVNMLAIWIICVKGEWYY